MKAYLCWRKRTYLAIQNTPSTLSWVTSGKLNLNLGVTDLAVCTQSPGDAAESWSLLSKLKKSYWMSSKNRVMIDLVVNERSTQDNFIVDMYMQGGLLGSLVNNLGHLKNLKLGLQISLINDDPGIDGGSSPPDCEFSELIICPEVEGRCQGAFCKQSGGGGISEQLRHHFNTRKKFFSYENIRVEISLIVSVDKKRVWGAEVNQEDLSSKHVNKKLLMEEVQTDLEIIAGNGVAFKCLSAFLVVQSEVIRAMLERDMQENKDNRILMEDVSENGVRALLAYLYYQDLEMPLTSSVLCVELLELSHKYLIAGLEDTVKRIVLDMPVKWFEAKAVVRLFLFSGKVDKYKDLRRKALEVIQSKPNEVLACEEYQRLFQVEEEDGGMEGTTSAQVLGKELCDALLLAQCQCRNRHR